MGTTHSGLSGADDNLGRQSNRLLFHQVHGENVQLSANRSIAIRSNSFCKGITFSERPIKVNEQVGIKFVEVSSSWSGVLRFGFTNNDPNTLRAGLPRYACPDLTSRPGFWARAFRDAHVKKGEILSYYVNSSGDVHFQINGQDKGIFFSGVDVQQPLWALIDIYGNTTIIEFVDSSAYLNNTIRTSGETEGAVMHDDDTFVEENIPIRSGHLSDIKFHRSKGAHVMVDSTGTVAMRKSHEYCNGYVFTSRPVYLKEIIMIKIVQIDTEFVSSMAFGVTSCDPQTIGNRELPDDSNLLIDRPEYWVVKKDLASNTNPGSLIVFWISIDGEVFMAKDNEEPYIIMHVDNSVPLWAFFDVYGTTQKVFLKGSMLHGTCETRMQYDSEPTNTNVRDFNVQYSRFLASQYGWMYDAVTGKYHYVNPPYPKSRNPTPQSQSNYTEDSAAFNNLQNQLQSLNINEQSGASALPSSSGASGSQSESSVEGDNIGAESEGTNSIMECVICCEHQVDSVFYTCGHMCMCYACSVDYWRTKGKNYCPMCRAPITDVIRTYK